MIISAVIPASRDPVFAVRPALQEGLTASVWREAAVSGR